MRPTPALAFRASIAASCAVAAARLFPYLGDRVMHRDEALAVMVARRPLGELLETVQLVRGGAPLHFLLAKLVAELGGGLAATRAISAIGMLLAIVAVGLLGRALGGPVVGAGAAWIVALSPVALYYGDFARMYSLFLAFSTFSLWCLVRALETDERRYWAGTAALLVLTTYTHPYGVVVGLIAAITVLAELLQVRDRAAWRRPLWAAAGVIAGTAPLGIGYIVLASRLDKVPQPPGAPIPKPSLTDVAAQASAHFVGVPRSGGLIALYLLVCGALAVVGLVTLARGGAGRAALVVSWILLPLAVLAVVRIPNSDNHVRYVIEVLPLAAIAITYGAATLGRLLGWRGALAAALSAAALVTVVEATRGTRLSDYRYRGDGWVRQKSDLDRGAGYLRGNFARNDLFLGYDEAFATGVLNPGHNHGLASARGTARSEPQLIVRSLKRLHGPIAHGWYVALRGTSDARYERFRARLTPGYDVATFGSFVLVHTRGPVPTPAAFARAGLRVFEAARELSGPSRAPSEQAAVTAEALRGALPDLR
ncbi:MAG TPA: glycosyltransferase family 39 protein [Gaiellales bacterium]|nr:glycosyltransferase family 39 protein [Gaiellales bacterium]